jgi:DNA-binding transcriptional MocR family regulator
MACGPTRVRDALRGHPARLLYLTPTFHNPTGATMTEGARREIARLASDAHFTIVEDESLVDIALASAPPPPSHGGPGPKRR